LKQLWLAGNRLEQRYNKLIEKTKLENRKQLRAATMKLRKIKLQNPDAPTRFEEC
tara:strand:+ start:345 stop:509 length:165 start_codon:yes stop_codon:yes gene_type:complete